jgi:molybdopterin-guanine dinucleotide biosynthesis protein A
MYNNITGIILSGGKSIRMGENKSLMKLGNITVIERAADLMKGLFREVILVTNRPDEYAFLNLQMYKDIYRDTGPLAGIHSGLTHSLTEKNFIISCDMPLMRGDVIKFLANYPTDRQIIIAKADGFIQQLCGVYSKSLLPVIEKIIKTSNDVLSDERNPEQKKRGCKVLNLVKSVDSEIIDIEKEYPEYIPGTFYNMNNPAEYKLIREKVKS